MIRRNFIRQITVAGAGSLAAAGAVNAGERRTVTYRVTGFSCPTCAVGLETLLHRSRGVIQAKASYPKAMVTIEYDPAVIPEASLQALISEMGFTAQKETKHGEA